MRQPGRLQIALVALLGLLAVTAPSLAEATHINVIELDNQIISPVTQQYITEAIARSEAEQAECLVLILDTPGGLLESTRAIVKRIMNAKVPVVVYVAPAGARAGSAGVFITLASHIAAMAPSTNIGAAHPVMAGEGGGPVKKLIRTIKRAAKDDLRKEQSPAHRDHDEEIVEEEQRDPMTEKILNDTVAWVTTIARTRHRNEEWAKKAVTESFSVTEDDAVKDRIVDLQAKDLPDLLQRLDGWPVEINGDTRQLSTRNAPVVRFPMTKRQQFLAVITNPNIAYLLMLLGTLGLVFEFTHPGVAFPGIAGLIAVILAMFAFQTLPVNYAGLALIGLGIALLIAEVKVASFGLLAVGGVVALTLGSLILYETPQQTLYVSLSTIVPVVCSLAGIILFVVHHALKAQARPVTTGTQGLLGEIGVASTDLTPEGKVSVHGELWTATSSTPVQRGERVRVVEIRGLHLTVEKVP